MKQGQQNKRDVCIFLATTDEKASLKGKKVINRLLAKLYESTY